jgi:hypothetical protein
MVNNSFNINKTNNYLSLHIIDYNKQTTTYATGATGEVNTGISDALQYC